MRDEHALQALARRVERRQLLAFRVGHRERRIGDSVAVAVDVGLVRGDADDRDHLAVGFRNPDAAAAVVAAERHVHADREPEKVLDVERQRGAELDLRGAGGDGFVDAELGAVGVAAGRGELRRHRRGSGVADGVLRGADAERGDRLRAAVREDHGGGRALREQHGRSAAAVGVGRHTAARDLHRRGGRQIDGGDLRVERDQHDVRQDRVVVPRRVDLALRRQESGQAVRHDEIAPAVDGEVEHAVRARQRLPELGVMQDRNGDARERLAGARQHPPAQDRDARRVDGGRGNAGLNRIGPAVEELGRVGDRRGNARLDRRRDRQRIRRQRLGRWRRTRRWARGR